MYKVENVLDYWTQTRMYYHVIIFLTGLISSVFFKMRKSLI